MVYYNVKGWYQKSICVTYNYEVLCKFPVTSDDIVMYFTNREKLKNTMSLNSTYIYKTGIICNKIKQNN